MQLVHRDIAEVLADVKALLDSGDHSGLDALFAELHAHPEVLALRLHPAGRCDTFADPEQAELAWEE